MYRDSPPLAEPEPGAFCCKSAAYAAKGRASASRQIGGGRLQIPCKCRPAGAGTVSGLFRLGAVNVQDLDRRGLGQHLAERMHPIAGLLARSDALVAKLVELIELLQFDLELQGRAVAMPAGQRHQHAGVEPVRAGGIDLAADEIEGALAVDRQHAIGKAGEIHRGLLVVAGRLAGSTPVRRGCCIPPAGSKGRAFLGRRNPLRYSTAAGLLPDRGGTLMKGWVRGIGAAAAVVLASGIAQIAVAQKSGGVLRVYHRDSPASMSIHEEGTNSTEIPMMGVFNNLVVYNQHIAKNSLATIRPELAGSWSLSEDGKAQPENQRPGVKWHDGKPFTAADVKCTWDLLSGRGQDRFRANPRKSWWNNVADIETNGDLEATFVLKRPQPALLTLIASGYTPVYPCHVPPAQMRQRPIGTGPFKFVEFKPNESIKVAKNPDYWKPGRPYLDGIDYTIIPNRSTAILAFVAGKYDLTFGGTLTIPLTKDLQSQVPEAICEMNALGLYRSLIVNREKPPFDNADLRRAMALSIDRKS